MFPRLFGSSISLRTLNAAALALSLAATVAFATPAAASTEVPDFTSGAADSQKPLVLGQRAVFPVVIENHGVSAAGPVILQVMVGSGLREPTIQGANRQDWSCVQASGTMSSTWQTFTCTTYGLETDSHKVLFVGADVVDYSDSWIKTVADPNRWIIESNEVNNIGRKIVGPSSEVRSWMFYAGYTN